MRDVCGWRGRVMWDVMGRKRAMWDVCVWGEGNVECVGGGREVRCVWGEVGCVCGGGKGMLFGGEGEVGREWEGKRTCVGGGLIHLLYIFAFPTENSHRSADVS